MAHCTDTVTMTKKKRQRQNFSKGTSFEKNWVMEDAKQRLLKVRDELGLLVKEKETPRLLITTKGTDAQQLGQMYEYQNRWQRLRKDFLLMGDDVSALLCNREACPDHISHHSIICNYYTSGNPHVITSHSLCGLQMSATMFHICV
jgi:hypothetical protein